MSKIAFAVLLLFTAKALSETKEVVISSFDKIYEKFHQKITDIENETNTSIQNMHKTLSSEKFHSEAILQYAKDSALHINSKVLLDVLKELNISANVVETCIKNNENTINKLLTQSNSFLPLCKLVDIDIEKTVNEKLTELKRKQQETHRLLDRTTSRCTSTTDNAAELRSCLTYELLVVEVHVIKQLKGDTRGIIKDSNYKVRNLGANYINCANFAKQAIENGVSDATSKYKECCESFKQK